MLIPGPGIYTIPRCKRYKLVQRRLERGPDVHDRVIEGRCDDDALRFRCEAFKAAQFKERTVSCPQPVIRAERRDIVLIAAKRNGLMGTVICEIKRHHAVL